MKLILISAFAIALFATAVTLPQGTRTASADYGTGAAFEIEISSNLPGPHGGGIWLWIALNQNGTGDYSGSDCGHADGPAVSDKGDVTWSDNHNGTITIHGVVLNGLSFIPGLNPVAITVPSKFGHESTDFATLFPTVSASFGIPSGAGFSQVQVAP